ncbi:hypothetical protein FNH22_02435 [Fulvivirga sp. M361]|uniref:hypothetical protein n=1 Tax=Fulvivirga sp. M361 TaxID=2594266 RepID=UPI00117B2E3A|nr:hypothetical protein [Fulvivirga sp. M361]TRX62197.1 hypothetical protein FNH22_02435 [Fulvivirga sp. M361]
MGARASGLGNAFTTLDDAWSVFNNPGAIGLQKGTTSLFSIERHFSGVGLNNFGAGVLSSIGFGTGSISVFKFGDDLYNEQSLSTGYGNTFGIASLGVRINYRQYQIKGLDSRGAVAIDFGGLAELSEELTFGAFIRNINQARLSDFQDERIPTLFNAGIAYQPSEKLILSLEAEKDIDFDTRFKSGLEYTFLPKFSARTGIQTAPFTNHFGMGFKTWRINIDYAVTLHQVLGSAHQASLSYHIAK